MQRQLCVTGKAIKYKCLKVWQSRLRRLVFYSVACRKRTLDTTVHFESDYFAQCLVCSVDSKLRGVNTRLRVSKDLVFPWSLSLCCHGYGNERVKEDTVQSRLDVLYVNNVDHWRARDKQCVLPNCSAMLYFNNTSLHPDHICIT